MAERIFRRKIYGQMLDWKQNQHGTTALLIRGARRVGKSTIAEEFARHEYESHILVDFSKATQSILHLFEDVSNLDYIFTQLQLNYRTSLKPRKSVIIFDEIQKQPLARQAIKTLVADGRYDYIETGSLLSIKRKGKSAGRHNPHNDILIPSEETRLDMYPMDYEEFCWALGDDHTIPLLHTMFKTLSPLSDDT
ncbi:MAG: AAA family ATPase, partial [Muribaculaceae bacterium]